ncbi:hypothetical protein RGU70_13610 [Herbaspirillum sp. RTI4]|uniref:LPD3 domain-containing protein n=1 Tax=Herbaspirillum sp. RTI4 TaxID=3048640 RepID=UPI002AB44CCC|nr:hypothetical protein [Herbaspirillum sp. RTI4]MDY7579350.1 hypothetical protein [Herbaspirillum sp. RTI4]MEA9980264.1 hypothetical protein [Herbaspirillum sp. RTI4]
MGAENTIMADTPNEFDDAAASVMQGQTAAIRNNVYNAVNQNPAQVAQHSQIAQSLGIPLESVQSDPATAKQQAAMQSFDANKVVTQYPHLAQFLTNPTNAAMAHTDLPTLAATEQAVKGLPQSTTASAPPVLTSSDSPSVGGWLSDNVKSIPSLPLNALQGVGDSFNTAAKAVNRVLGVFPTAYDKLAGMLTGKDTTVAGDAYNKNFIDPLDQNATALALAPGATTLQKVTHGVGNLVGMLAQIAGTGGMSEAPAVADAAAPVLSTVTNAVSHAARSMAFPSITAAVNSGTDVYNQTGSLAAAVKAATAAYATNTAMGVLPMSMEGSLATRVASGVPVGMLTGEVNRQAMNASLPAGMQQPASVEDAIVNGITGSILAGAMGANPARHEQAVRQMYADADKAQSATQGMQGLQALGELSKASTLRQNDPQAFHDFVQKVTEDGHLPEVWVDGKTLSDALNQSGISADELQNKMPDVAAQMHEALQTNGDVRISTADYATNIAGGSLEQGLLPHLKTDPDGMTFQQGQDHLANQQSEMTAQAKVLTEEQAAKNERDGQLKDITDGVQQRLEATGRYPADVAKTQAGLYGAFYDTAAEGMKISPKELVERMPLPDIKADGQGGFNQASEDAHATAITGTEFGATDAPTADLRNAAKDWYKNNVRGTTVVNEASGREIKFEGSRKAFSTSANPEKIKLFAALPELLRNGTLENSKNPVDPNREPDTRAYHWLTGTVNVGGEVKHVGVTVREDGNGNLYYNHNLIEKGSLPSEDRTDPAHKAGGFPSEGGTLKQNLAPTDDGVNLHVLDQGTGNRGSYDPATNRMALLKDADLSTFLHESGHFFLERMHEMAQHPEAPRGIKDDFDTLLQHFGVQGETPEARMADWSGRALDEKRGGHEQFAEGFENYLMSGKAPTPELQSMFSRFRSWLMSVYQSMRGEVSPEVRGVMDRMFASQEAINEAERVRAYAVPDLSSEHGDMIDQYKALGHEATEQAIADMQARSMRDMKYASNAKSRALKELQRTAVDAREAIRREVTPEVMRQPVYQAWQFLTTKGHESTEVRPDAKEKNDPDRVNPAADSMFTAIAKFGGLKEEEVKSKWGIPRKEVESDVFGKPVVRKEGGLSIDRMAEVLVEHHYLSAHDLHEFEEKFGEEFAGTKQHSWQYDIQGKERPSNPLDLEDRYHGKLNTDELRGMYGTEHDAAWRVLSDRRMTSDKVGIDPEIIADTFSFNSAREMVDSLAKADTPYNVIKGMTDQRMLERHGELVDPVSIERAAEAAIHNEVRAKMMATGLKMFTKSPMSVIEINKAAKAAADTAIAAKAVGDLRPAQYSAAETKSNRALLKLAPKDPAGAAVAQREALLNNRLFKSASEAVTDVRKGMTYLSRLQKPSVRGKIDIDVRDQIDGILSRFDLRANPTDAPTRPQLNLEKWIESQAAAGYSPTVTAEMLAPEFRKPYREMSVEEFRGMVDTIRSMEHMGKERNLLSINGEKLNLSDFVNNELVPKLQERGDRFSVDQIYTKPEDRGISQMAVALDHVSSWLRGLNAQLKPQEFKRNDFDRHELLGPFGKALFDPVLDANYNKVRMQKGLSDDFRVKADELGGDWQKSLHDMLPNDKLVDAIATKEAGVPVYMKMSRGKMVGMALHVGNESNFDKLTKGYGWEPEKVWGFLHDNMTANDWNAVQHVWDLYEKHWPDMQAMYRRLGQTTPDKIEPRAFKTPFGEMDGGYAAIKYDPLRSRRGEKDAAGAAIDPGKGLFGADYFSRSATTNGSMNKRIDGYTDAIDLNFHTIERSLQESIHDLAYREALINANKIVEHPDFRKAFLKAYGREDYSALQDWIGRIANSDNSDRAVGAFGRFMQYTRTGMVMNAIALRATTVLKHGGSAGIKTLGYFAGGGEKYLASRFAAMGSDYTNQITGAKEKFGEINARLLQQDRDYRATASSMFEPESVRSQAERFGHSAVAWSDMMTAVPTAWAAYDRAIAEGIPVRQGGTGKPMTEAQAVSYANKIVREAHGSNVEAARSNIMTAPSEGLKLFTTLYGFMNNSYGQMADSINKFQTPGLGKPEIVARTLMAIIVPALWAGYLSEGGAKEGESWGAWAAKAITGEVAGMVPVVRDAYSMAQGFSHAGVIGAESWMSTMVNAGKDVVHAAQGKPANKPVSDIADAVGMGLHIPGLGQLGKSAQYVSDVQSGKQHPANAFEYAKGMVVGAPHKK